MYEPDITNFIGDALVDETEPNGVPFDAGDPHREYQDQEIRELNTR